MATWGVRVERSEVKPCFPGTDVHDRSVGKWYPACWAWMTKNGEPETFVCHANALEAAVEMRHARRNAHPPFSLITTARYGALDAGERVACQ